MLVTINQIKTVDGFTLELNWKYQEIPFTAVLNNHHQLMIVTIETINGIEVLHVPYSKSARTEFLVQDLKLKLVSQALINQADLAGKLGVSA